MSTVFHTQNFAKLLAPILEKRFNQGVLDFDSDDYTPNCVDCPECGYDGEGLEERVAELEAEVIERLVRIEAKIDKMMCGPKVEITRSTIDPVALGKGSFAFKDNFKGRRKGENDLLPEHGS